MANNVIPFPKPVSPDEHHKIYEDESVSVLKCSQVECGSTDFYVQQSDQKRIICCRCLTIVREDWV